MKTAKKIQETSCPSCGASKNIVGYGFNRSGTQRCKCLTCGKVFTQSPKKHFYSEEIKQKAIKTYFSGVSGRGVGKIFSMSKANVYRWIKKT